MCDIHETTSQQRSGDALLPAQPGEYDAPVVPSPDILQQIYSLDGPNVLARLIQRTTSTPPPPDVERQLNEMKQLAVQILTSLLSLDGFPLPFFLLRYLTICLGDEYCPFQSEA